MAFRLNVHARFGVVFVVHTCTRTCGFCVLQRQEAIAWVEVKWSQPPICCLQDALHRAATHYWQQQSRLSKSEAETQIHQRLTQCELSVCYTCACVLVYNVKRTIHPVRIAADAAG